MSEHHGTEGHAGAPGGPAQPPRAPAPSRPPAVRLPTWVVVVLLLTLFASCSAANRPDPVVDTTEVLAPSVEEVTDLCRLLGAVAGAEGLTLDEVFAGSPGGECQHAARVAAEGATARPAAPSP